MKLTFVTGNKGKLHEATEALSPMGFEVAGSDLKPVEIQADSLLEISRAKCEVLVGRLDPPFMVDDGGLFVPALNDFPGVYSAHALKTIGVPGILKLMEGVEDRRARMETVLGLYNGREVHLFPGVVEGELARQVRTAGYGFGFDPIFIPRGSSHTFAEMSTKAKALHSHRGRAFRALAQFLFDTH